MKRFLIVLLFVSGFSVYAMEPTRLKDWQQKIEDQWSAPDQEGLNFFLRESAQHGDLKQVKAWFTAGAQLNSRDDRGQTALIKAAASDHEEVCSWLIDMSADITLKDRSNMTALHEAARNGNEKICELLVRQQKRVNGQLCVLLNEKNDYGLRPCDFRDFFCLNPDNLAPEKQAKRQMKLNKTLLKANNVERAKEAIALGAEIDARDRKGRTVLIRALKTCRPDEQLALLLAEGANPNARDNAGCTPLIWAMKGRAGIDFIKALIAAGADVNAASNSGRTPLMCALGKFYKQNLKILLANGARVTNKDQKKKTVLMEAASLGWENACIVLVDHQAKLDARVMAFLWCLKKHPNPYMRNLYHARINVWAPLLGHCALKPLLAARDYKGQTAYDKLTCEFLRPK